MFINPLRWHCRTCTLTPTCDFRLLRLARPTVLQFRQLLLTKVFCRGCRCASVSGLVWGSHGSLPESMYRRGPVFSAALMAPYQDQSALLITHSTIFVGHPIFLIVAKIWNQSTRGQTFVQMETDTTTPTSPQWKQTPLRKSQSLDC